VQPSADAFSEANSPVEAHWTVGEQLARQFHLHSQDMQQTLDTIVESATDIVEPAHYGGLITVTRGHMTPQATCGEPPYVLDVLQQQTGSGPCLTAAASQQLVCIDDTRDEPRWPEFTARAVELGVRSVICVPLWVSEDVLGTLSLYSQQERVFGPYVQVTGLVAAHAALALATATLVQQLRTAFLNRDIIGQAKGILMERHRITADDAFRRLSAASQATNRKLFEICASLAETGALPD
jgi:GAF domain-containing protein